MVEREGMMKVPENGTLNVFEDIEGSEMVKD